jgi:uncharacterized membrane protein
MAVAEMKTIEKAIEVNAPVDVTYNQWTQFEEFPRFMEDVEKVRQLDDKHVHWVAEIAGKKQEWDAEITRQIPDKEIDWVGFGDPENRGRIVFEPFDSQTRVVVMLEYEPEGSVERLGHVLGMTDRRVESDLMRFKEFIESRGRETGGWRDEIHGDEVRG